MTRQRGNLIAACVWIAAIVVVIALGPSRPPSAVLVRPYLQDPADDAVTVRWVTTDATPGRLTAGDRSWTSEPAYESAIEAYVHRVRVDQLGSAVRYTVEQSGATFAHELRGARRDAVRFIALSDIETEPESTGKPGTWSQPDGDRERRYPVDQTTAYAQNLKVIASRAPDFIAIAGDLVERGGRQVDWDEFWRHVAGDGNDLAGSIPLVAAPGNHENFAGKSGGGYSRAGAHASMAKFRAYFEAPHNGSLLPVHRARFHRIDYGPITLVTLDSSNGQPDNTRADTNWMLDGTEAPDFHPGSYQYVWLEHQLRTARRFVFVQFHHAPYSVGPHGVTPGDDEQSDRQSGQPMRVLTPLFARYRVAAVFVGHDEMYEHSIVDGVHFFDVGIGGDDLRGPVPGVTNPHQVFLAHRDAQEIWDGKRLVSGGKHYGHLEINVSGNTVRIEPVYVFPLMNAGGAVIGWERRVYADVVELSR